MLVLSRRIGQAVVIDDQFVVTVERFDMDSVTLSLVNTRGVPLGRLVARRDASLPLFRDVELILIKAELELEKVRLGFQCSDNSELATRLARKEHWSNLDGGI